MKLVPTLTTTLPTAAKLGDLVQIRRNGSMALGIIAAGNGGLSDTIVYLQLDRPEPSCPGYYPIAANDTALGLCYGIYYAFHIPATARKTTYLGDNFQGNGRILIHHNRVLIRVSFLVGHDNPYLLISAES